MHAIGFDLYLIFGRKWTCLTKQKAKKKTQDIKHFRVVVILT